VRRHHFLFKAIPKRLQKIKSIGVSDFSQFDVRPLNTLEISNLFINFCDQDME